MSNISVVVPAYNAERTIGRAIESVLNQTYCDWELIIIDDGSTDNMHAVIETYNDERIRYYKQANAGPGAARNRGIKEACGNYLMFLDSDDAIHRECLSTLVDTLEKNNADISMCSYAKVDVSQRNMNLEALLNSALDEKSKDVKLAPKDAISLMYYKKMVMPYPFLKMFRMSAVKEIRFPEDIKLGEDQEFNLKVFKGVQSLIYTSKVMYFYITNSESITHTLNCEVASEHFFRLLDLLAMESDNDIKKALVNRIFVVAYDFLSQTMDDSRSQSFLMDCKEFISNNKSIVMRDKNASQKVRLLAVLSNISVDMTVAICKKIRKVQFRKAL